jgi:glycosyltransferase involved in cell wall biosynthesis
MRRPLVSIIIPCYNSESFVADAIQCSLDQTYQSCEIIVIDDGSTDRSAEIIESFGERIQHVSSSNKGGCSARNLGFEKAMGSFIQFLDSDDLMAPDKIEKQLATIESHPNWISTCPYVDFENSISEVDASIDRSPLTDSSDPFDWIIERISSHSSKSSVTHSFLTPRELIRRAGPWNENLKINQDGEFFTRVLLQAEEIRFEANTQVYYRRHQNPSVSKVRSSDRVISSIDACKNIASHVVQKKDNEEIRQALRQMYLGVIHTYYPQFAHEIEEAESAISELGFESLGTFGGPNFQRLSRIIGFKNALRLRHLMHYSKKCQAISLR